MNPGLTLTAALAAVTLALGACDGGGSSATGGGMPPGGGGLPGLIERFDALQSSAVHSRWSVAAQGETISGASAEAMTCAGARCTAADGTALAAGDLALPAAPPGSARAIRPGARGGFDTVTMAEDFGIEEAVGGVTVTASPEVTSYGFWGAHGFAALTLGAGPLSGESEGVAFSGTFGFASAWAAGDASGSNPAGLGSATWTGIAEAAPKDSFARLRGTATVTIADLSRPRVGVAIDVPGHDIGAPGWADMALDEGRFSTGSVGSDRLSGGFYGPAHEEAWGRVRYHRLCRRLRGQADAVRGSLAAWLLANRHGAGTADAPGPALPSQARVPGHFRHMSGVTLNTDAEAASNDGQGTL